MSVNTSEQYGAATTRADDDHSGGGRRSVRGFAWTALSWGGNRLVVLGLTIALARWLTPEDFGLVTAALTIITMLDAALDLGVGAAVITQQQRGVTTRVRAAMTVNLTVSGLVAVAGIAAAPLTAGLFDAAEHRWLFVLIFTYPLFRGMGQVSDAVLKRDLQFRRRTVVDCLRAVTRAAVSIPLALTVGGAISIAAGIVVAEIAATIALWILVPILPTVRHLNWATTRSLLSVGGQVTVIRVLGSLRAGFDYLVVGAVIGTVALGYYGMAYKLPELAIENVLWIFSTIALPMYARAVAAGSPALMAAMIRATRMLSLFGLGTAALLVVIARDAIPVIFSPQWQPAVVPMMLIAASLGLMSVSWASGDVFTALGRPGVLIAVDIPATAVMIAAFVVATRWGLVGVATVHLAFNFAYLLLRLATVCLVTRVALRTMLAAVAPAAVVATVVVGVGLVAREGLPAGEISSLVLLTALALVTGAGTALVVARNDLLATARALVPSRFSAARQRTRPVLSESR